MGASAELCDVVTGICTVGASELVELEEEGLAGLEEGKLVGFDEEELDVGVGTSDVDVIGVAAGEVAAPD